MQNEENNGLDGDSKDSVVTFPIVAIGASAGGVEACSTLLKQLPANTGMAFVIVLHLHPDHESVLSELFGRTTNMPVKEIQDGMLVQADHVYVIPPNTELIIFHDRLQLTDRNEKPPHLPIDRFMTSLAEELGSNAIGIILSGTASDGVLGLQSIKAAGGITFSQDEKSAKYDGMPHSAIAAGCVDFILPPAKIAQELLYLSHHPYVHSEKLAKSDENDLVVSDKEELSKLFYLLRKATGIDFSYYKITTLRRRINRRMVLHKKETIKEYIEFLESHEDEIEALYMDILINVTEFFRDADSFDVLKTDIFPKIIQPEKRQDTIRIWIPGCSTGEEAYSMAITLLEYLDDNTALNIQIFATDIDDLAIEKARSGIYPESISGSVSKIRLRRFFNTIDSGYQIKKNIRDLCVFAKQNVFKDPPFSNIDLVSCRNLLIYLVPALQKRILTIFHYALKPNGILSLGSAESIGELTQMYETIDQKHKFYRKKSVAVPLQLEFSSQLREVNDDQKLGISARKNAPASDIESQQMADRMIMQKYAPAAVLINQDMHVLQFRGHTGPYLEPAPGEASLNIMKLVSNGLLMYLRGLLQKSMDEHVFVKKEKILHNYDGQQRSINIEVTPIQLSNQSDYCYLIVFEELTELIEQQQALSGNENSENEDQFNSALKQELAATKEYLQSVIEQKEVGNEELRSANEEIQSSNEELQSINEELETAKEELQSTNEELATVNEELETRNVQLARLNDDHNNFVNSLNIAFVTVDNQLKIRNYTPKTADLMNIISTDIGRPLSDIKLKIQFPDLEKIIYKSLEEMSIKQIEFQDEYHHWYSMRIRPYRTSDNRIDGAVIAFIDVNEIKANLDQVRSELDYVESIISAIRHPMLVLDKDLRVVSASEAYFETFQVTQKDTIGNLLYHLGSGEWATPKLRTKLENVIINGDEFDGFSVHHKSDTIGDINVNIYGRKVNLPSPENSYALMQIEVINKTE